MRAKYQRMKKEQAAVREMAAGWEERSQARMESIRPQKRTEGSLVWRPAEVEGMSALEREMQEATAKKKAQKKSTSVFDYIDPFGIFGLKAKADNLNKEIQKNIQDTIDQTVVKPVKNLLRPKNAQQLLGQQWENQMQQIAGSQHEEPMAEPVLNQNAENESGQ